MKQLLNKSLSSPIQQNITMRKRNFHFLLHFRSMCVSCATCLSLYIRTVNYPLFSLSQAQRSMSSLLRIVLCIFLYGSQSLGVYVCVCIRYIIKRVLNTKIEYGGNFNCHTLSSLVLSFYAAHFASILLILSRKNHLLH